MARPLTIAVALGLVLTCSAVRAADNELRRLRPSGPWAMEYADSSCRLISNFTDGENEVTLALERFAPATSFNVGVAGASVKAKTRTGRVTVSFGSNSAEQELPLFNSALADGRASYMIVGASLLKDPDFSKMSRRERDAEAAKPPALADELAAAEAARTLLFTEGFTQPLEFQLGSMAGPIKAMHACTDELMTHWGIDAHAYRSLSRVPTMTNLDKLTESLLENWPDQDLMAQRRGFVRFRLMVDSDGRPQQCTIIEPSGPPRYVELSCQTLMRLSRFTPALDAQGRPIASFYVNSVIWLF